MSVMRMKERTHIYASIFILVLLRYINKIMQEVHNKLVGLITANLH